MEEKEERERKVNRQEKGKRDIERKRERKLDREEERKKD